MQTHEVLGKNRVTNLWVQKDFPDREGFEEICKCVWITLTIKQLN